MAAKRRYRPERRHPPKSAKQKKVEHLLANWPPHLPSPYSDDGTFLGDIADLPLPPPGASPKGQLVVVPSVKQIVLFVNVIVADTETPAEKRIEELKLLEKAVQLGLTHLEKEKKGEKP